MRKLDSPRIDYRSLWSAVVLQAIEDIETQPMQSLVFADAVAFFTRSGSWAESRSTIADFLDMHRDELEAIGRRCIDARRFSEDLQTEAGRQSPDTPCVTPLNAMRTATNLTGGVATSRSSRTVAASCAAGSGKRRAWLPLHARRHPPPASPPLCVVSPPHPSDDGVPAR